MLNFQTPTKPAAKPSTKSTTQPKLQDWICLVCNNLNFSFRKKCNRCKSQTRSENEYQVQNNSRTVCSYYYCEDGRVGAGCSGKSVFSDATNLCTPQRCAKPKEIEVHVGVGRSDEENWPVTRQYRAKDSETTVIREKKVQQQKCKQSRKKDQPMHEYWQFINVQDFDQLCQPESPNPNPDKKLAYNEPQPQEQPINKQQEQQMDLEIQRMFDKILLQ